MKKIRKNFAMALILLSMVFSFGCAKEEDDGIDFVRGSDGLVMSFIRNAPQDKYIISTDEPISIAIDVWNKGAHPKENEETDFNLYSNLALSGFDQNILEIDGDNWKGFGSAYLLPATPLNPKGSLYTAEFKGNIIADKILVEKYEPTILATACYLYHTAASPTVCIDPFPFDERQEKVCNIGSQALETQGSPISITKIDQEAASGKIRFKIGIKNVGKGDVIWYDTADNTDGIAKLMDRCSPADLGKTISGDKIILDRKDFDKVKLDEVKIGDTDIKNKCTPFAEGTSDIIRLFDGEGFIVCTYDVPAADQSAYTTTLSVKLDYAYKSTISKKINIRKIE